MTNLNSVIKTLIKINLAAGLLSLVALMIIRHQQAQQIYSSSSSVPEVQNYHSSFKQRAQGEIPTNSVNTLKLAKKVEKLEGELAQTKEKLTGLSKDRTVRESNTEDKREINLASRVPTKLSLSPEYQLTLAGESQKPVTADQQAPSPNPPRDDRPRANTNTPARTQQQEVKPSVSTQVLKNQEIAQANHLEQQKLGLSKPQTLQAKTSSNLNNAHNIHNQKVTPLPLQPLAGSDNRVLISLTGGNSEVSPTTRENRENLLATQGQNIAEEARLLFGNSEITLSSADINNSRLVSATEKNASIRLANDIAYGLIIAGEKGHINYGTKAYRRVQTAIRVLRRGENLYDAARIAEVPSEQLQQLIRWGENRPGSLAAMIETNPDNRDLR